MIGSHRQIALDRARRVAEAGAGLERSPHLPDPFEIDAPDPMSDPSPADSFPTIFGATGSDAELYASGFVFAGAVLITAACMLLRHRLEEKISLTSARPWYAYLQLMLVSLAFRCAWCFLSGARAFSSSTKKQCLTGLSCAGPILITALNRVSMLISFAALAIFSGQLIRIGRAGRVAAAVSKAALIASSTNGGGDQQQKIAAQHSGGTASTSRADPFVKRCDLLFLLLSVWMFVVQMVILLVSFFVELSDTRANSIYNSYIIMVAVLNIILVVAIVVGAWYLSGYLKGLEGHHRGQAMRLKQMVGLVATAISGESSATSSSSSSSAAALSALLTSFAPSSSGLAASSGSVATVVGKGDVFSSSRGGRGGEGAGGGADDYDSGEDGNALDFVSAGGLKRQGGKVISGIRVAANQTFSLKNQLKVVKGAAALGGSAITTVGKVAAAGGRAILSTLPLHSQREGSPLAGGFSSTARQVAIAMGPASASTAVVTALTGPLPDDDDDDNSSAASGTASSTTIVPVCAPPGLHAASPLQQQAQRLARQQPLTALASVALPSNTRDQLQYERLVIQKGVSEGFYSLEQRMEEEKQWRDDLEKRRKREDKEKAKASTKSHLSIASVAPTATAGAFAPGFRTGSGEDASASLLANEYGMEVADNRDAAEGKRRAGATSRQSRGMERRADRVAASSSSGTSASPSPATSSFLFRSASSRSPSRGRSNGGRGASSNNLSVLLLPEENLNQRPDGEEHDSGVQLAPLSSSSSPAAGPTSVVLVMSGAAADASKARRKATKATEDQEADAALAPLLLYARGLIRTHEETRSKLSLWRKELLFLCFITSLLLSVKSVMFALRPVFNVSIGGTLGVVVYPWFFYTVNEALPAILIALTISGLPLHLPLVLLYQLIESLFRLAASFLLAACCICSGSHALACLFVCCCCCKRQKMLPSVAVQRGYASIEGEREREENEGNHDNDDAEDGDQDDPRFSTLVKAALNEDSKATERRRKRREFCGGLCNGAKGETSQEELEASEGEGGRLLPSLQFGGVRPYLSSIETNVAATLFGSRASLQEEEAAADTVTRELGRQFVEALARKTAYRLTENASRAEPGLHTGLHDEDLKQENNM